MASRLFFNPLALRTPLLCASVGAGAIVLAPPILQAYKQRHALRADSSPSSLSPADWSFSQYQQDARTPIVKRNEGLNTSAVRQLSAGSIIGLVAGLGISIFSKPLVVLLGLLIAGVQTAESYGVHLVPYGMIKRYAGGVDLRSAVQDNAAFKLSFGMMFALSAFAQL